MGIKNRLKEILDERGIKQKWLAEKANVKENTLSGIINNKTITSVDIAIRIAKVLNMAVEDIFQENDSLL
jgi:DNA-binding XRE family transcriptional regulator